MKVYKNGIEALATVEQWPALKAAGWSKTPDAPKEEPSEEKKPKKGRGKRISKVSK